jgi:protein-disulfide isomerase
MSPKAIPRDRQLALLPVDEKVDHVRGSAAGPLILEYGDYECPYSRQAFHAIEQVNRQLGGNLRFAFRHFPLTDIHPHAFAASAAAEAAARQGRFWDMHDLLFHRQKALEDGDLRGYAAQLGLDVAAFDRDRASTAVADRIRRDFDSGLASGQVLGTPTLFIDGVVHRGGYDPPAVLAALASLAAPPRRICGVRRAHRVVRLERRTCRCQAGEDRLERAGVLGTAAGCMCSICQAANVWPMTLSSMSLRTPAVRRLARSRSLARAAGRGGVRSAYRSRSRGAR